MTFLVVLVEDLRCDIADLEYEIESSSVGKAPPELVETLEDACNELGSLARPGGPEVESLDATPQQELRCVIVQPFVLAQHSEGRLQQ